MLTKTKAAIVTTLFLSLGAQADTILNVATAGDQNMVPRFYVSTSKSIIKALINMHSFEIQLSPIG
ncbi:hypothetical protein E8Q43_25420 [Klebsiella pneumoniae subsp. pneumoniae]|nr:hypothetical protein E8Q43_25420 [Klebsiella pneumoniae subsp. pneumoniae]